MKKLIIALCALTITSIYADYHAPRPSYMDEEKLMEYNNQKNGEFSKDAYSKVKSEYKKDLKEQYKAAEEKAKEAYEAAKDKAKEAYEAAKEFYQKGKEKLSEKYKKLIEDNN